MLFLVKTKLPDECKACLVLCTVDSLVTTVVVVVVNKSLDSKEQIRAVFLRLDVNILVFYRFLKSFYPDIVFSTAAAVHADLHFRVLRAGVSPFLARKLAALIGIDYFRYSMP